MDAAKRNKKDEFYTAYDDIQKELIHYARHFKNKVIYCNCDDHNGIGLGTPKSNFLKYLADNFQAFGIKKVIATHYVAGGRSTMYILDQDNTGDGFICSEDISEIPMRGDGDFRSDECVKFLKSADIVITNPPFSLLREYIGQLIKHKKHFIIIGNINATTYKEFFPLIKNNKMWIGASIHSGDREFQVPDDYPLQAAGYRVDKDGNKFIRVKGVRWFTNLDYNARHEILDTGKRYYGFEYMYPRYINYDAINVDKTADIPMDYDGIIGVPITFLDKYNPDQFEIVELGIVGSCNFINNKKMEILDKNGNPTGKFTFNAKGTLYRAYNPNNPKDKPAFKDVETGELYSSIYARILIRKKKGN